MLAAAVLQQNQRASCCDVGRAGGEVVAGSAGARAADPEPSSAPAAAAVAEGLLSRVRALRAALAAVPRGGAPGEALLAEWRALAGEARAHAGQQAGQ
jgi:hypothetical protein